MRETFAATISLPFNLPPSAPLLSWFCNVRLWRNLSGRWKSEIAKSEHKRQNICDLKWQIWHQRAVRAAENREKSLANAINFHLSINFVEFRLLTKRFASFRIKIYAFASQKLCLMQCAFSFAFEPLNVEVNHQSSGIDIDSCSFQ